MIKGKLVNGELILADSVLITESEQIFNAPDELWLKYGWKNVIFDNLPDEGVFSEEYEETETDIRVIYTIE